MSEGDFLSSISSHISQDKSLGYLDIYDGVPDGLVILLRLEKVIFHRIGSDRSIFQSLLSLAIQFSQV